MLRRALVYWGLAASLGACGFELRGQATLPPSMASTYIAGQQAPGSPPSSLALALARALKVNGINIVDKPESATARLLILDEDYRRRILATGDNGVVREYQLEYWVEFALADGNGAPLTAKQQLRVARDILYNEADVLGRVAGEELARTELIEQAAAAMLRRIQALSL